MSFSLHSVGQNWSKSQPRFKGKGNRLDLHACPELGEIVRGHIFRQSTTSINNVVKHIYLCLPTWPCLHGMSLQKKSLISMLIQPSPGSSLVSMASRLARVRTRDENYLPSQT